MSDKTIESTYLLDVSGILASIDKVDSKFALHEERLERLKKVDPFKTAAKNAGLLDQELSEGVKTYVRTEQAVKELNEEFKRLSAEQAKIRTGQKELEAAFQSDNIKRELQAVQEEQKKVGNEIENTTKKASGFRGMIGNVTSKVKEMATGLTGTGSVLARFSTLAAGAFAVVATAAIAVGAAVYKARERYMEMNDIMLASTGNQKDVSKNLEVLDTVASQLEITLREVTAAYITLNDQGLKVTKKELNNIGTLAKELKSNLNNLAVATVAADKGNVDSLQKLGLQAVVHGDRIKLSFRGVTSEFKKGSGEAAHALSEITEQIEKTENSASSIGRMDFMDRLAKGFVDAEMSISDAAEAADRKAYPAFERLMSLVSRGTDTVMDWAESFGIWVGVGWEHVKNDAMLLIAALAYLPDVWNNKGFTKANENIGASLDAFKKNRKDIFDQESRSQSNVGKDQGGDLINNGKLTDEQLRAQAEADKERKRIAEKAGRDAKKAAEDRNKELLKTEKDLQNSLSDLESKYSQNKLEALKGDYLKYLEEKRKLDIKAIDEEEKTALALFQLSAGAKSGRFDKENKPVPDKSAQLPDDVKSKYNFRREVANDLEYDQRAEYISKNQREITRILSDEYQKQQQDIEYHYAELIKLAKQSGIDTVKLEKQKLKDLAKAKLENQISKLDSEGSVNTMSAELDVVQAQIDGRIDAELAARKKLLEIEKMYNDEKIRLIETSGDEDAKARILPLLLANKEIQKALADIDKTAKTRKFTSDYWIEKIFGKNLGEEMKAVLAQLQNSISELYQTLVQQSQERIGRIDSEIDAKKQQVETENELNEQGSANNLDLRQKELEILQNQRERAAKDAQRLQKASLIADTVSQASSMITASAKVFGALAGAGPFGVAIAAAAVAAMFVAFGAAKVKAFQSINAQKFEFGGQVKGERHSGPNGGELILAEGGEYVTNRKSTSKYYDLIEAINQDNTFAIGDYLLKELLSGTGVGMTEPFRNEEVKFMREYNAQIANREDENLSELRSIRAELAEIKKSNDRIPKVQLVNVGPGKYAEIGSNSTVIREIPG